MLNKPTRFSDASSERIKPNTLKTSTSFVKRVKSTHISPECQEFFLNSLTMGGGGGSVKGFSSRACCKSLSRPFSFTDL